MSTRRRAAEQCGVQLRDYNVAGDVSLRAGAAFTLQASRDVAAQVIGRCVDRVTHWLVRSVH